MVRKHHYEFSSPVPDSEEDRIGNLPSSRQKFSNIQTLKLPSYPEDLSRSQTANSSKCAVSITPRKRAYNQISGENEDPLTPSRREDPSTPSRHSSTQKSICVTLCSHNSSISATPIFATPSPISWIGSERQPDPSPPTSSQVNKILKC